VLYIGIYPQYCIENISTQKKQDPIQIACPIISVNSLPPSTSSSTVNVSGNVNDAEAEVFVEVSGTTYGVTDFDTVTGNFSRDVTLRTGSTPLL
jgi:hypothetical protein